jgi:hypothetical protein
MSERREEILAWAGSILAVLHFAWRAATFFRLTTTFSAMFEGLGAELPLMTRLAVEHRIPVLSLAFGLPSLIVLGKEFVIQDKRTSLMLTMLIVIIVLFISDLLVTAYYLPLFDLIGKLS